MSKNYLITGAARGIGRGLSRHLLSKSHRVLLVDNDSAELTHLSHQLPKWFPEHHRSTAWRVLEADVSTPQGVTLVVDTARQFFAGRLDALVNNAAFTGAAGSGVGLTDEKFPELWERAVRVNLTAPVMLTRGCVGMLRQGEGRRGGSVVMVSSTRAWMSEADSEGYAATKAGLVGVTHAMACSLAEQQTGIRVNAVLPGWIHVENECKEADDKGRKWEEGLTEEDMRWHWAGRVGRIEDIARAVDYLCDDGEEGSFITGTEMVVDGGVTRKMVYPE